MRSISRYEIAMLALNIIIAANSIRMLLGK